MTGERGREIEILMVEDSPSDAELTRDALEDAKLRINLNVVGDGEDAMEYLGRRGRFASATRPDIILLDLNLPRKDAVLDLLGQPLGEFMAVVPVGYGSPLAKGPKKPPERPHATCRSGR